MKEDGFINLGYFVLGWLFGLACGIALVVLVGVE